MAKSYVFASERIFAIVQMFLVGSSKSKFHVGTILWMILTAMSGGTTFGRKFYLLTQRTSPALKVFACSWYLSPYAPKTSRQLSRSLWVQSSMTCPAVTTSPSPIEKPVPLENLGWSRNRRMRSKFTRPGSGHMIFCNSFDASALGETPPKWSKRTPFLFSISLPISKRKHSSRVQQTF